MNLGRDGRFSHTLRAPSFFSVAYCFLCRLIATPFSRNHEWAGVLTNKIRKRYPVPLQLYICAFVQFCDVFARVASAFFASETHIVSRAGSSCFFQLWCFEYSSRNLRIETTVKGRLIMMGI